MPRLVKHILNVTAKPVASRPYVRCCMKHVAAHYDGEKVVLDEPISLPANTPVEVVLPDSLDEIDRLGKGLLLASVPTLKNIWDNSGSAVYDNL